MVKVLIPRELTNRKKIGTVKRQYDRSTYPRSILTMPSSAPTGRRRSNARTGGFLGIENKFVDNTYSATIVQTNAGAEADPTAPISCLDATAIGTGESNRDGRKVRILSAEVRGSVTMATLTTVIVPTKVRIIMVLDTQTNATQLNSEDVFLPATNVEDALRNLEYISRFKVYYDKVFTLKAGSGGNTAAGTYALSGDRQNFHIFKKLNYDQTHTGNTKELSSITDKSLHIICFCDGAATTLKYESRVRFVG